MSRQNMRKLMLSHAIDFLSPVHEGSASVWHLSDILAWLTARGCYEIKPDILEVAKSAKQINLAKEAHELEPRLNRQLEYLVA